MTLDAHAEQKIDALVLAGSVAVAGGQTGVAVSGSGVFAFNQIGADVNAYIDGNALDAGTEIIEAGDISLYASDTSIINNTAGAASAAVALGQTGVAVSIGGAIAINEITTSVDAHVNNMQDGLTANRTIIINPVTSETKVVGDISIRAEQSAEINATASAASIALGFGQAGVAVAGAGASATNYILTHTNASLENSSIFNADAIDIDALNESTINATVVAASAAIGGGQVGVGASIGVSIARNLIGYKLGAVAAGSTTYTTGDSFSADRHFNPGDTVLSDGGITDGDVYEYIGPLTDKDGNDARLLLKANQSVGSMDLRNTDLWRQINLNAQASELTARVLDTSINAQGTLSVTANSDQTINAEVLAGSAAVGAGQVGVGVSGAGVSAQNQINSHVEASITGDGTGITVGAIDLDAIDDSKINALAGAASLAAGFGQVGVAVSIGVAVATNKIDNTIESFIIDADNYIGTVRGDIDVHASDNSTIDVNAVAAALGVGIGQVGVALAGAGAIAENLIGNDVHAFIDNSEIEAAARFDYDSTQTLVGNNAIINPGDRVRIVNDLQGGVAGDAGDIYEYIGLTPIDLRADLTPVIHLDSLIYENTEVVAVLKPGATPPYTATDYDLVRGWRLLDFGTSQDVRVSASNTSSIDSLVGGAAAAVSGGMVAVSGAVGMAIARNMIGAGAAGTHETYAYIEDSDVIASGDISISAAAQETIEADVFAGSVALAVGIGGAAAGAGASVINHISSDVQAYAKNSDLGAVGDIDVLATSSSNIKHSDAIGVAVSGGLVGASIAVSLNENTIDNTVAAFISSTGAQNTISADGDLSIIADVTLAKIKASAETASVSAGAYGISGGGINIDNVVRNNVDAGLQGNLKVDTAGDIEVKADENTEMSAKAISVTASFSLGAAVGASVISNLADSDIEARITDAAITSFGDIDVIANSDLDISDTDTAGIAGSLIGVTVNTANASARNTVKASISGANIHADGGTVTVKAMAENAAEAAAKGGAVGAIAVGAMVAETHLGTAAEEEVVASIGDNTFIRSANVSLTADSNDDIFADADALSGGLVGLAGADVDTSTRQDVIVRIGDNVDISTGLLEIMADHTQSVDAAADAVAFGLAAGTGVDVDNLVLGQAIVDIGANSKLLANNMFIDASNVLSKERFKTGFNLNSGSVSLVSIGVLTSTTEIGNSGQSFDARVDIGDGTLLRVDKAKGDVTPVIGAGSRDLPRIEIETYVNAKAVDNVKVEAASYLVGGAYGESVINADTKSQVNIDGATIVNSAGDVFFTTRTDTLLRPNANLTVVSGLAGGAFAHVSSVTDALNEVNLNNADVRGSDISLFAGQDSVRAPNVMFTFADAQVFTASILPSIGDPTVVTRLNENNIINILGDTRIEAASDINLYAVEGIGGDDRAKSTGGMLSLSAVPYGVDVVDDSQVVSNNQVNINNLAYLEAGVNNLALYHILPVATTNNQPGFDLPSGVSVYDIEHGGVDLTVAQKAELGLPADADFEYEGIKLDSIGFFVDNGTVIQDNGHYYMLNPNFIVTESSLNLVLTQEDYTDTTRWTELQVNFDLNVTATPSVAAGQVVRTADDRAYKNVSGASHTVVAGENFDTASVGGLGVDPIWEYVGEVYASNVTDSLAADLSGKFYVIKPVELEAPVITYVNLGGLLVKQLKTVDGWIANHAGDNEAIARYEAQRTDILLTMTELGMIDGASSQPIRELDTIIFDLPDIISSAGSVFINVDNGLTEAQIQADVDAGRIVSNAGARIDIQNKTPLSMAVNDAIIEDNRRIEAIGGGLVVFTPGNVYVNGVDLTGNDDSSAQEITILQDALLDSEYDFDGLTLPDVPQDLFIAGDVINENGDVTIINKEGSISVSGIIRGEEVTVVSAKNFSLNTDGWYHTNQDPRQYIDYTDTRNTVFEEGKSASSIHNYSVNDSSLSVNGKRIVITPVAPIIINVDGVNRSVAQNPTTTETDIIINLENSIQEDDSMILSQGRITITAKYLNINGLIQSGVDNIEVDIAAGFTPPATTTALSDEFNEPIAGVSFGTGLVQIPVDGYWDAANQRIVLEEIVPQGGTIILAGQIVSTGNGTLRVANGYTDVNINNQSNYDLYIERIDVTKNKVGKIQITDTSTPDLERTEYTYNNGQVTETLSYGSVTTNADGLVTVDYVVQNAATLTHAAGATVEYDPVSGSQYVWVEGQEKTQTEVKYYKKNTFNIIGGGTWLDDALVGDDSYQWRTFAFTDEKPLLESEAIVIVPDADIGGGVDNNTAYSVEYKVAVIDTPNETVDDWETGGGWLRKKTYHKLVTTVTGLKDFYTHTLEADRPIDIDFIDGPTAPEVNITSAGSISFGEINVPDTVDSSVVIKTTSAGANILQNVSAGIFGTNDVVIDSGGTIRANIEGIKVPAPSPAPALTGGGELAISAAPVAGQVGQFKAAGDIWIGFFETEAGQVGTLASDRKVIVDYIWSTDGDVYVSAPDGIFAKDANSFIIGNQVELYAKDGSIGTALNPIFIDTDVHDQTGDGGILAWAQGDIYLREMEGDLYLAQQLDLAAGFDTENPDAGLDNLKSTYDEIRPEADGSGRVFSGSIHSTTGSVNLEVVGGSVIDAIEEGYVALTPEEIQIRNERLGLTGAEGEAKALAELDADAEAKTEAYHRYWSDFRDVERGAAPVALDTLTVLSSDVATEQLTISVQAGASALSTGDEVVIGGNISNVDLLNAGLLPGASYFVIVDAADPTLIQLAATHAEAAITGVALNITGNSSLLAGLELQRFDYTESAFTANMALNNGVLADFTSSDSPAELARFDVVRLDVNIGGGTAGETYLYNGSNPLLNPNLASINYASDANWTLVAGQDNSDAQLVQDAYDAADPDPVFGDRDQYDADYVFTYTQQEKDDYVAANTFSGEALENPVSPGLMKVLYPHTEFGDSTPNSEAREFANITAGEVVIVAGTQTDAGGNVIAGKEGSIGSKGDIITINNPIDFEALPDAAKVAMANATPDDLVGVHYTIYEYTGAAATGVDLEAETFAAGWTAITTDYVTGTDASASVISNVAIGQTVLVQLDAESYGLYRATQAFSGDIADKAAYVVGWERLTDDGGARADHDTTENAADLLTGDIVLNKHTVQTLTLQLFDDIDIEAQDDVAVNFGANAGGQVIVQTSDNLKVHHVLAGGDVRLQASSSSTANTPHQIGDSIDGGSITGDGTVAGNTANPANDIAIGTLGNLTLLVDNSIGVEANPLRIQIAPTGTLSLNVVGQLYLHQISGTTLDIGYQNITPDTVAFDPATRGFSVTAGEVAQFGYVNTATSMQLPELIKIAGSNVAINDLTVENASAGGSLLINIVDETGVADTGNLIIGKIQAGANVDLRAPESILDLFEDAAAPIVNILTDDQAAPGDVYLQAGIDIGTKHNFIDVDIRNGALTGQLTNNAFIYGVGDLAIGGNPDPLNVAQGLVSSEGNISLLVQGVASIGLITANGNGLGAQDGLVTIQAGKTIVDRRGDGLVNIDAKDAILRAPDGIGEANNALDTKLDRVEAHVPAGGLWLDNSGPMSIGQINGYALELLADNVYDQLFGDVDTLADSGAVFADEIGIYVRDTLDISNIGNLTLLSTSISESEVLMDVSGSILDDADSEVLDIIAPEALLVASVGVGTDSNELETLLSRLEAEAGAGGLYVDNLSGLVIGDVLAMQGGSDAGASNEGVSALGTIRVTSAGFMTVREDVVSSNADLTLQSIDSVLMDDPMAVYLANILGPLNPAIIPQTSLAVEDVDLTTGFNNFEIFHTANDGSDTNDEDFKLTNGANVRAATVANILGGDDILIDKDSTVQAGTAVNIRGDHGNADAEGARIDILGHLNSPLTTVSGERDKDVIYLAPQSLVGNTRLLGDNDGLSGGDDILIVDQLPTISTTQAGVRDSVTLDGRGGNDEYTVFTTGDANSDYIINVLDSGARNDGADRLFIEGTADDDVFLSRQNFVAHLHEDSAAVAGSSPYTTSVERINYDESLNGRLRIDGLAGDDQFYSDDNSTMMTLDGGAGEDFFQIGQVFGLDRVAAPETMIAAGDEIETVATTLGFLSQGISFPTTVLGGDGNDRFVVYSNQAALKLFGDDGNDEFVVRAFVLTESNGITISDTTISGGDGDDAFEYNINAPVNIDGGAGADSVVIIGTEKADTFVITEDGVQGAGLAVDFDGVERLEVDGLEGDDHFFVLSTDENMVTTLIGGLGADTIDVGGDVTGDIVALSVEGRSGFVNHAVSSDDPAYNGVFAEGLQLNVADQSTGAVVITESGNTAVVENDHDGTLDADEEDSYTVKLTIPAAGLTQSTLLYVTVSAALASYKEDQLAGKNIEIAIDDGSGFGAFSASHVLTFDSTQSGADAFAWDREITVKVRGLFDNAEEGEKTVVISHSSYAEDKTTGAKVDDMSALNIRNVEVTLYDDDKPGLILSQLDRVNPADANSDISDAQTQVYEGDVNGDIYELSLTKAPAAGEIVTISLGSDFSQLEMAGANINPADDARLTWVTASGTDAAHYAVSFDAGNWNDPFKLRVTAVDDGAVENKMRVVINHSIESNQAAGEFAGVGETTELRVDVRDNDSAGIIVKQSNGSTLVSDLSGDDYTIELTKQPTADVQVQILTDGQTLVDVAAIADPRLSIIEGVPTITFTSSNWNNPFEVLLVVNPDAATDAGTQPVQTFPAQPHLLNEIRGPLIIEGSTIPAKDRTLSDVVMLPTELDGERPIVTVTADEDLNNDVLNVFADGSLSNDVGALTRFSDSDLEIKKGLDFIYEAAGPADLDISEYANISGLQMGNDLDIDFGTLGLPDIHTFAGGITYRGLETVEIMLGQGNDTFEVATTVEDSITVIHGGGNSAIELSDVLSFNGADISRADGIDWSLEGFEVGQQLKVERLDAAGSLAANEGTFEILAVNGSVLTLSGGFTAGSESFIVSVVDSNGDAVIGGDHITVTGGGGVDAPLIIFGDTSQDGSRYNFATVAMSNAAATSLQFTHDAVLADTISRAAGSWLNDGFEAGQVIDIVSDTALNNGQYRIASISADGLTLTLADSETLLDEIIVADAVVSAPNGNARSFVNHGTDYIDARGATGGVTIYGGQGDDTIYGSEFDDQLAGGSGDDTIHGQGGRDHIYGDDGFNIDISERLNVVNANGDQIISVVTEGLDTDVRDTRDALQAGNDSLYGDEGDDIIIGDHGIINQVANTQRLTDAGQVIDVISDRVDEGGDDTISGGDGDDLIIGGAASDTIQGDRGEDIIFGDSGFVDFDESTPSIQPVGLSSGAVQFERLFIQSISRDIGGDDQIQGNENDDIIIGGFANDVIEGDEGNDTIFGDNGDIFFAAGIVTRMVSTDQNNLSGGDDVIDGYFAPDVASGDPAIMDNDLIIAGVGSDTVRGNLGDDVIIADNGEIDFNIVGGDGNPLTIDLIRSTDITLGGDDTVYAGQGNDIVIGGFANDVIEGDEGNDTIFGDNGDIFFAAGIVTRMISTDQNNLSGGDDVIDGYFAPDVACGDPAIMDNDLIIAGVGSDTVRGNLGDDVIIADNGEIDFNIAGGDGDPLTIDLIHSTDITLGGDDTVHAGEGNDIVIGGFANDSLHGDVGSDLIFGDNGTVDLVNGIVTYVVTTDTSAATGGNDTITGDVDSVVCDATHTSNDILFGGVGNDTMDGARGDDVLFGDNGEVFVNDGLGSNTHDPIRTLDPDLGGIDVIQGGDGDDRILGGAQGDFISDTGGDNIVFGDHGEIVGSRIDSTDLQGGADVIETASGNDTIIGGADGDTISSTGGNNNVLGDHGTIVGRNVSSSDIGRGGADTITTGNGSDNIIAGTGGDSVSSGGGNDNILGDDGTIRGTQLKSVAPNAGGADTIIASGGNNNIIGGAAGDNITSGGGSDNVLGDSGTISGNTLTGNSTAGGNDIIKTGGGSDNVIAGAGADNVDAGAGNDNVLGDNGVIGGGVVRTTAPTFGGNDILEGSSGNDVVFGGFGSDWVSGGSGNDMLLGDNGTYNGSTLTTTDPSVGGNDQIYGGTGDDWALGGAGGDFMSGGANFDVLIGDNGYIGPVPQLGENGEQLYIASTSSAYIGGADRIDGGSDNDILIGGFGSDTFVGNLGDDILIGDAGVVIFSLDGQIYLSDTFGADPLDRFVLFNLFGRDLKEVIEARLESMFTPMEVADAYAMQELRMGNEHRFQHHNEPNEQAPAQDKAAPKGQPVDGGGDKQAPEPAVQKAAPPAAEQASVDIDTMRDTELKTVENIAQTDDSGLSGVAGSAVILSLAGWRRKKAILAEQRAEQRRNSKYRVVVDQDQLAGETAGFAQAGGQPNQGSRMVFDTHSGKLRRLKSA